MLDNFSFFLKTKIYFGKNAEDQIGDIIAEYGFNNVLIIIGQHSVRSSGLLDKIINKLDEKNIKHHLLEGIRPNPTINKVKEGLDIVKKHHIDLLLPIGGGSTIDTAKCIAVNAYYDGDIFDFNRHKAIPTKALPIGAILTISAAGSECSTSCVIQDDELKIKQGFNSELIRPLFAIENPALTLSTPKIQTFYGVTDILMHTLERYFSPSNDLEFADYLAEGLIKAVIDAGRMVNLNPNDYHARETLMIASSLSHNGLTNIGKSYKMPVHLLEHVLSAVYPNVAHAAGLAILFPRWANEYMLVHLDKFARFAEAIFNVHENSKIEQAKKGIQLLTQYFREIGMPNTFNDLNIKDPDIDLLVQQFSLISTPTVANTSKPLDEQVARKIYQSCLKEVY